MQRCLSRSYYWCLSRRLQEKLRTNIFTYMTGTWPWWFKYSKYKKQMYHGLSWIRQRIGYRNGMKTKHTNELEMLPAILDTEMASYNTQNHCSMLFLHHPFGYKSWTSSFYSPNQLNSFRGLQKEHHSSQQVKKTYNSSHIIENQRTSYRTCSCN
jgi:hypothetical protein